MNHIALLYAINPSTEPTAAEAEAYVALHGLCEVWKERARQRRWMRLVKAATAANREIALKGASALPFT